MQVCILCRVDIAAEDPPFLAGPCMGIPTLPRSPLEPLHGCLGSSNYGAGTQKVARRHRVTFAGSECRLSGQDKTAKRRGFRVKVLVAGCRI